MGSDRVPVNATHLQFFLFSQPPINYHLYGFFLFPLMALPHAAPSFFLVQHRTLS